MLMADSEELIGTTKNDTIGELSYKPMSLYEWKHHDVLVT